MTKVEGVDIAFVLNGEPCRKTVTSETTLIAFLREDLGLTGTKIGCSIGRCGACLVDVDGSSQNACLRFVWQIDGCTVTTIEGLDANPVTAHVKAGLLEESAFQCGYCAPGFVVALVGLLSQKPQAGDAEVIDALEGNICRCTGYHAIVRGALNAAARVRGCENLPDQRNLGGVSR